VSGSPAIAHALIDALDDDALEILAAKLAPKLAQRLPAPPADDGWIDTKQAARYLGITTSSLWKLTAARAIPFAQDRPGAKCWFRKPDLDRWRVGA
jgi:excisionase family DNA binding protein